jgi:hypothetical protein
MTFFTEIEKNTKVYMEQWRTMGSQSNLEQKEPYWSYHNTRFQATLHNHNNKNSMTSAQNQIWIDQWNTTEHPGISPHRQSHLILDGGVRNIC